MHDDNGYGRFIMEIDRTFREYEQDRPRDKSKEVITIAPLIVAAGVVLILSIVVLIMARVILHQ